MWRILGVIFIVLGIGLLIMTAVTPHQEGAGKEYFYGCLLIVIGIIRFVRGMNR
jgi:hypothetical protein